MSNLEGLGRMATALRLLDEAIQFTQDDKYRLQVLRTKTKLLTLAADVIEVDLAAMEREMNETEQPDD